MEKKSLIDEKNFLIKEIRSPFIGYFYISNDSDLKPFVKVGSQIKKGHILCTIQSLGLTHEIKSECNGEIIKITLSNGDLAEFGAVLFHIKT